MTTVGVIVNPLAGKDIRRLVTNASPVSDASKIGMVRRAVVGAIEGGATRVLLSDDHHHLCRRAVRDLPAGRAEVAVLDEPLSGDRLDTDFGVRRVLAALAASNVVTIYSGGEEPVYAIERGQHLVAAFYRNSAIHHFLERALAELVLLSPPEHRWEEAMAFWRTLPSDAGAVFDAEVALDAAALAPTVTWGTSPQEALPITGRVPDPADAPDPARRAAVERMLAYMGLAANTPLTAIKVDRVFVGSCTNSRLEDLRAAAAVVRGRRAVVPAWAVPGSGLVKRAAEAEGLDRVFREAGFEWREPGCSMCVGMNGDTGRPGERVASTSNRNFEGRQGKGVRTHLMSPAMAAAAAVTGRLTDVRSLAEAV